jgi:hypothetical protein
MSEGSRADLATEIIAKKIIELAREGERDTVPLRDRAIEALSGGSPTTASA